MSHTYKMNIKSIQTRISHNMKNITNLTQKCFNANKTTTKSFELKFLSTTNHKDINL